MLRVIWGDRGQNIHLMTNTRSELYKITFFKNQSNTLLQIRKLWQGKAMYTVDGLVPQEFEKDKKCFIFGI